MKVLLINGSPNEHGCTDLALREVAGALEANGISTEMLWIGKGAVRGCIACGGCKGKGRCVFGDDAVNKAIEQMQQADERQRRRPARPDVLRQRRISRQAGSRGGQRPPRRYDGEPG